MSESECDSCGLTGSCWDCVCENCDEVTAPTRAKQEALYERERKQQWLLAQKNARTSTSGASASSTSARGAIRVKQPTTNDSPTAMVFSFAKDTTVAKDTATPTTAADPYTSVALMKKQEAADKKEAADMKKLAAADVVTNKLREMRIRAIETRDYGGVSGKQILDATLNAMLDAKRTTPKPMKPMKPMKTRVRPGIKKLDRLLSAHVVGAKFGEVKLVKRKHVKRERCDTTYNLTKS